ncbi:MAG TPA: DUF3971 domain-containing protein, partial [Patescibacteria group bacterium]|nr:DUF3971 domain-containing protein [Patescibacteria group bacterium]
MTRKFFGHSMKISRIALEWAGVLTGIGFFLLILFLSRISVKPINLSFARHTIEHALHDPASGYDVHVDAIVLEWTHLQGSLMLDLRDIRLVKNHQAVLRIAHAQLGLSGLYLLAGQIRPVSIMLANPTLHLVRTEDNKVRLSLEPESQPEQPEAPPSAENPFMDVINTLSAPEGSVSGSILGNLNSLRISDAGMIVEDHAVGVTWFVNHLEMQFARDAKGLAVMASARLPGGRKGDSIVQANAIYARDTDDYHVNLTLQDFDPRIVSRKIEQISFLNDQDLAVDGSISAVVDSQLRIHKAALSVTSATGTLNFPRASSKPIPFDNFELRANFDGAARKATLEKIFLNTQGVQATIAADFDLSPDEIRGPVKLSIPNATQAQVKSIWPDKLGTDTGAYHWIVERLSDGAVSNVAAEIDIDALKGADKIWTANVNDIKSGFDITGMTVDYRAPLTPVKNASGHGTFANDTIDIGVDSGMVGDIKLSKGHVKIDNVIAPDIVGTADITAHLESKLTSVFDYIANEPIGIDAKKIGLEAVRMKGQAALDIDVSFPTSKHLRKDEVVVKVKGPLRDVLLPHVLKDLDLTSSELDLTVADGLAGLKGKGKLDGNAIDFQWQEYLDSAGKPWSSQVIASGEGSDALRGKLALNLDKWVKGTLPTHVVYTQYPEHKAEVAVTADAGPGMLMIPQIDYTKAAGVPATVKCTVKMTAGVLTEVDGLEVKSADIDVSGGKLTFADHEALRSLKIPRGRVGKNDGALDLTADKNGNLTVTFKGPYMDARPFLAAHKDKALYDGPEVKATIDAAKVLTREGHEIKNAKVFVDIDREGLLDRFDVDATAGTGPLSLHLTPRPAGGQVLRIQAQDAGETLAAMNIYDNVVGGTLSVNGASQDAGNPRDLHGTAEIDNFHVIKAPALARMLADLGPMNLPQMLKSEQGIGFSKLEADFLWAMRRKGDVYVLTDGRTSGNSLGLTFAGKIDKQTDMVDITGDVVPVSEVNSLIGHI